jgi:hypothetical protein
VLTDAPEFVTNQLPTSCKYTSFRGPKYPTSELCNLLLACSGKAEGCRGYPYRTQRKLDCSAKHGCPMLESIGTPGMSCKVL